MKIIHYFSKLFTSRLGDGWRFRRREKEEAEQEEDPVLEGPPVVCVAGPGVSGAFAQISPSVYRSSGFYLFRAPEISGWALGADVDDCGAPLAYAEDAPNE